MIMLTSVDEAALNAFSESVIGFGLSRFAVSHYPRGISGENEGHTWYAHTDVGEASVGSMSDTLVGAVRDMLEKREVELTKPPEEKPARKPSAVKERVAGIIDEYRGKDQAAFDRRDIDEIADRVAAIPVKE